MRIRGYTGEERLVADGSIDIDIGRFKARCVHGPAHRPGLADRDRRARSDRRLGAGPDEAGIGSIGLADCDGGAFLRIGRGGYAVEFGFRTDRTVNGNRRAVERKYADRTRIGSLSDGGGSSASDTRET